MYWNVKEWEEAKTQTHTHTQKNVEWRNNYKEGIKAEWEDYMWAILLQ